MSQPDKTAISIRSISTGSAQAALLSLASFILAAIIVFLWPFFFGARIATHGLESGKVAERDLIATRDLSVIDPEATKIRRQAEERLVLPVFVLDPSKTTASIERFAGFATRLRELVRNNTPRDSLYLSIQRDFPGMIDRRKLFDLVESSSMAQVFANVESVLRKVLDRGIVAMSGLELDDYNPDYLELRRLVDERTVSEELPFSRLVTKKNLYAAIEEEMSSRYITRMHSGIVGDLVQAFVVENVFFDVEQTLQSRENALRTVEPVLIRISSGERIIRKGSMVSEEDFSRVLAIRNASLRQNWNQVFQRLGLLAISILISYYFFGSGTISGLITSPAVRFFFPIVFLLFFLFSFFVEQAFPGEDSISIARYTPTAFISMIVGVLAGSGYALLCGMVLALLAGAAAGLSGSLFMFVFIASVFSTYAIRSVHSRIDLVRAALFQGLFQGGLAFFFSWGSSSGAYNFHPGLFAHAGNGFLSGVLAMAILPFLEKYLNVPTKFRLAELSDLLTPAMKRLQSVAPGTWSHSVSVAQFAETAAREIGANELLARVGAYYHDFGKMEQPEYFIENQTGYNKHEEINPRLSATVIRSHVKIGAEKARNLGLPVEIVDIIAQHHGTSVITWFFEQAKKIDPDAREEDFCYTSDLPVSREAGIVMLADAVEAASRTLQKPNGSRIDQFVREIINGKISHGQLDRCELSFADLEIIRLTFTRILASHFHSRIEYPKESLSRAAR